MRGWAAFALLIRECSPIDIYSIQHSTILGDGADCYPSPLVGTNVTTSGVVTSVHKDSITIQSAAAEWSGISIHTTTTHSLLSTVRVGDEINVSATVAELAGMTVLQNITSFEIMSSGNSVGAVLVTSGQVGSSCNAAGEAYEGVLVVMENVEVDSGATCDAISVHSQGSSATLLSLGSGTFLTSITGTMKYAS